MEEEINQDQLFQINEEVQLNLFVPPQFLKSENNQKEYKFSFEQIFTERSKQEDIFNELSQLIQSVLDGYNVCIFAYGQTGSGKTFTMEGSNLADEFKGIIPRGIELIFNQINFMAKYGWKYDVIVSFVEIYLDQIIDLLTGKKLVNDIINEIKVNSPEEIYPLLRQAQENRQVAETACNERSSRSHRHFLIYYFCAIFIQSVFQLKLNGINHQQNQQINGTLNLVDLAGSERLNITKAEGERLREAQAISKSLSSLGDVITALAKKDKYIPYRNSKLTYLLQNYLGGDSKTLMFVNLSPELKDFQQTLCSLRFADKVKNCNIGVAQKHIKHT